MGIFDFLKKKKTRKFILVLWKFGGRDTSFFVVLLIWRHYINVMPTTLNSKGLVFAER